MLLYCGTTLGIRHPFQLRDKITNRVRNQSLATQWIIYKLNEKKENVNILHCAKQMS